MKITVELKGCIDCRHRDHSGAFTPGGSKSVCDHWEATDYVKKFGKLKTTSDEYHWNNRIIDKFINKGKGAPIWCPLKHGRKY